MASDTDAILSPELLAIMRCPSTGQRLAIASKELIERIRAERDLTAALVREDGKVIYPIRNGIPMLLREHAIAIS